MCMYLGHEGLSAWRQIRRKKREKGWDDEKWSGEVHKFVVEVVYNNKKKIIGPLTDKINTQMMGRFSRQGANK